MHQSFNSLQQSPCQIGSDLLSVCNNGQPSPIPPLPQGAIFQFIGNIPSDTRVPNYAYQNVTASDTFNATLASTAGGAESTSIPTPTSAVASSGAPSTSPSTSGTASSHSHSKAGVIAGATVGGIVGAALIAALLYLLWRRRHPQPTGRYDVPLPKDEHPGHPIPGGEQMKLYDPNDPTTFPPSFGDGTATPAPSYQIQHPSSAFMGRPEV
ncbi:hypothetical protein CVT25_004086 [Psilocybe cyanescens]|uniref:Mid2 domain-containing protein n=1 Tax=Psilocybe cyanescens TaxID=93625 RepID=A0A409X947_PSICY|nr:hypothetical protein CVT25_004086 [Psilocybe cyanescens]